MKPIVIIAPHAKIAHTARQIAHQLDDVQVRHGLLERAIDIGRQVLEDGAEVLISRGGTAQLLEQHFSGQLVVEFAVTPYDLVKAVHQARKFGKHILVIGFERVIQGIEQLAPILDVNITVKRIQKEEQAEFFLDQVMRSGARIDVLIGGAVAESLALRSGIATVFLETGQDAIESSIKEARRLMDVQRKERQKTEQFKAILHYINEGVMAIDAAGRITTFNSAASKVTGILPQNAIGHRVDEIIPNDKLMTVMQKNRAELGQLQAIGKTMMLTNRVPIVVNGRKAGAVATFENVTKIQEYERTIRSKLRDKGHLARYRLADILGSSPAIRKAKRLAEQYATVDSTVLISGESGTGKEMFAQGIHNAGSRKKGPFVAVNCSAIPSGLLESELFGYEEGAFTGARKKGKPGLFTAAHGGTIFLDEIGEIATNLQARLLRVIQEREVRPLGSDRVIPIDLRIIAATNKNLLAEVDKGKFRRDLYYRIGILNMRIPPLRHRREDIALLSRHFAAQYSNLLKKQVSLSGPAFRVLENYAWPGNIRELENIIERVCVTGRGDITAAHVRSLLQDENVRLEQAGPEDDSVESLKRRHILQVLEECGGVRTLAAKKLGMSRTSLWRLLKCVPDRVDPNESN